jgi:4-carboxymuconolactone decarboxylase
VRVEHVDQPITDILCDDLARVGERRAGVARVTARAVGVKPAGPPDTERIVMGLMDDAAVRERTRSTSATLFRGVTNAVGFDHWKRFDKGLARDLSLFFTGVLYSREVISQKQRELCAIASLTVLHRPHELHVHIHAALNVGATRQEVAEVLFQQVTYGGMPVVVDALEVYGKVLEERGEPFPGEESSAR